MMSEQLEFPFMNDTYQMQINHLQKKIVELQALVENMNEHRTARMREVDRENEQLRKIIADGLSGCSRCNKSLLDKAEELKGEFFPEIKEAVEKLNNHES